MLLFACDLLRPQTSPAPLPQRNRPPPNRNSQIGNRKFYPSPPPPLSPPIHGNGPHPAPCCSSATTPLNTTAAAIIPRMIRLKITADSRGTWLIFRHLMDL